LLVILTFYFYKKYMKIVDSVAHIPGPPIVPFLGNALSFIGKKPTDIIDIGTALYFKYGAFTRILLGPKIVITLGDPEDIEVLLSKGSSIDKSEEYEYTKDWIGEGLITSTGQKWFGRRKIITPAFHFSILQGFVKIFDRNSEIFVEKLSKYEVVDIFPLTLLCALDNICEAAMGRRIDAQSNSDSSYVNAVKDITSIITKRHMGLHLRNDFIFKQSGLHAKQQDLLKILHGFTDSVIVARREELTDQQRNRKIDEEEKEKSNLIDILLQSTIDGKPLSNMDIREEVDTFMFAGHDTSTSGIGFCLYNLAKYPEVQEKAFQEVKSVIGQNEMTLKDLNNLSYLELVIKETMRLYSPVPFIGRKMREDTVINGKMIPKGANIVVSPLMMGMNEAVWKNAKEFIPERFELENISKLSPFAYLPFSAGPRNCIGQKFAMLEMKCTIAKVLSRFELSVAPDFTLKLKPEIVLKPSRGIILKLKARHNCQGPI